MGASLATVNISRASSHDDSSVMRATTSPFSRGGEKSDSDEEMTDVEDELDILKEMPEIFDDDHLMKASLISCAPQNMTEPWLTRDALIDDY